MDATRPTPASRTAPRQPSPSYLAHHTPHPPPASHTTPNLRGRGAPTCSTSGASPSSSGIPEDPQVRLCNRQPARHHPGHGAGHVCGQWAPLLVLLALALVALLSDVCTCIHGQHTTPLRAPLSLRQNPSVRRNDTWRTPCVILGSQGQILYVLSGLRWDDYDWPAFGDIPGEQRPCLWAAEALLVGCGVCAGSWGHPKIYIVALYLLQRLRRCWSP